MSLRTLRTETARTSRVNGRAAKRYDGIFDGYANVGRYSEAFDEMFDGDGNIRGPYKGIFAELAPSDASELAARADALVQLPATHGQHARIMLATWLAISSW